MFNKNNYPKIELLERIAIASDQVFIKMISRYYPISDYLYNKYEDLWEIDIYGKVGKRTINLNDNSIERYLKACSYMPNLTSLPWSIEFIEKYKTKWKWHSLSRNINIPWSIELIDYFKDYWDWSDLSKNPSIPWSIDMISRFEEGDIIMVSQYKFKKQSWDWNQLSSNPFLPWSIELIERFKSKWNWKLLSSNTSIPWSIQIVEAFQDERESKEYKNLLEEIKVHHEKIKSENEFKERKLKEKKDALSDEEYREHFFITLGLNSTELLFSQEQSNEQLEQYSYCWDWNELSNNPSVPWGEVNFYNKYKHKKTLPNSINIDLPDENNEEFHLVEKKIELRNLRLSEAEIDKKINKLDWIELSINESLPWSIEFIKKYEDKWNWKSVFEEIHEDGSFYETEGVGISDNIAIPWSIELIDAFKDKWDWVSLSNNASLTYSLELIDTFSDKWDWMGLLYPTETYRKTNSYINDIPEFYNVLFSKLPEGVVEHLILIILEKKEIESKLTMKSYCAKLSSVEKYTSKNNVKYIKFEFKPLASTSYDDKGHIELLPLGGGLLDSGLRKLKNIAQLSTNKEYIELYENQKFNRFSFDDINYIKIMKLFIGNIYFLNFSSENSSPQKLINIKPKP